MSNPFMGLQKNFLNLPLSITYIYPFHYISYITFSSQLFPSLTISFLFIFYACLLLFFFYPFCSLLSSLVTAPQDKAAYQEGKTPDYAELE